MNATKKLVPAKPGDEGAFYIPSTASSSRGGGGHWRRYEDTAAKAPAAAPAPAPPPPPAPSPYTPTPLVQESESGAPSSGGWDPSSLKIEFPPFPEPKPPEFSPGGVGSSLDNNAAGFRRKKSAARASGLTTKGTSRFKIGGNTQSYNSSGLNIGV